MHIGIDLGGTKTEIAVIASDSKILIRKRIPSIQGSYVATLDALHYLISQAEHEAGVKCTIGIGIPGAVSPDTGLIKNANSTWLIGHDLAADLEIRLQRQVRIANDADCFTLSEATDGAVKDYHSVFGVILGTGVGGGICINKKLLFGPNAIAGEWGHNPLPWPSSSELPGHKCYCGKHGCIESWLSGPALEREYHLASERLQTASVPLAAWQIGRAHMNENDESANQCMKAYCDRLARGLASVINILDPHAIVLGGGLSNIDAIYATVTTILPAYVFSDQVNTRIIKNYHGDSSGVRGAAWLGASLV